MRCEEAERVVWLARRLLSTPPDQQLLFADRLNDLDIAVMDHDRVDGGEVTPRSLRSAFGLDPIEEPA